MHKVLHAIWIMIVCCITCCQAVGHIIQAGNSTAFNCTVENVETSQWRVQSPDGSFAAIAQNGQVYSHQRTKFKLSVDNQSTGRNHSYRQTLTLVEATGDDDGTYRCEEEGQVRTQVKLTVEIRPTVWLEIDNSVVNTTNIDVESNKGFNIQCTAEGGKPPGELSWKVNGEVKIDSVVNHSPPSSERRVTTVFYYVPTEGDKNLTCVASGQQVIQEQKVSLELNVQYSPNCSMAVTNTHDIICSCKANPEVERYEIYVNDILFSEEMNTTVPSEKTAAVYCKATNDVGSFKTESQHFIPIHEEVPRQRNIALIIGLSLTGFVVVVVIVVAAWAIHKKQKKDLQEYRDRFDAIEHTVNVTQQAAIHAMELIKTEKQRNQDLEQQLTQKPLMIRPNAEQGDDKEETEDANKE